MKRSEKTKKLMLREGFVTTEDLADATTLHISQFSRLLTSKRLTGRKVAGAWYVQLASAQKHFGDQGCAHLLNDLVAGYNAELKTPTVPDALPAKKVRKKKAAQVPATT